MSKALTFNAISFLRDFNLPYSTDHHHCSSNRVQTHCPFCEGSRNYHLGIHITSAYTNCWRCGHHSIFAVIKSLLHCSNEEAKKIFVQYKDVKNIKLTKQHTRSKNIKSIGSFIKPISITKLNKKHKKYLENRKFNTDILCDTWKVQSIGPIGDYKHRIYIPIIYLNQVVSFQGRSIVKNPKLKYKTCKPENEAIHHKNIIYGNDQVPGNTIVVVEGVTDAWRLGPGAVATFGTSYTQDQVLRIGMYKNIFIMFDNDEPNAQKQGRKLAEELAYLPDKNIKIVKSPYKCDPGELPQSEADQLMAHILNTN